MSADEHAAMHAAELADGAEMVIRSIGGVVPPGAPQHLLCFCPDPHAHGAFGFSFPFGGIA